MGDVSVIIPARKEKYLNKTILEIQKKFKGDYEIIVTLDGADEERLDGVKYILNEKPLGMRTAINQAVNEAKCQYIMKLDAHCMLDEGIDEKLKKVHKPNWVQIPTRKRLDAHGWKIFEPERPFINYMKLSKDFIGFKDGAKNRSPELAKKLLDDTETFQGSCYFMEKDYFEHLVLLDNVNFAGSGHEAQEVGFKVKNDRGRLVRNKTTWYAHARMGRKFSTDRSKSKEYIIKLAEKYGFNK